MKWIFALSSTLLVACATAGGHFLYFPALARQAAAYDPQALAKVLELADTTSPGEQLEELAQIASSYVREKPETFLRAQSNRKSCFGVDFLGAKFVDNESARLTELNSRREALESISDPDVATVKARCLAQLHGS